MLLDITARRKERNVRKADSCANCKHMAVFGPSGDCPELFCTRDLSPDDAEAVDEAMPSARIELDMVCNLYERSQLQTTQCSDGTVIIAKASR